MKIKVKEGEHLGVDTLGSVLLNMDKLLKATGKEMGIKTIVLLKDLVMSGGEIAVHILITRSPIEVPPRPGKKKGKP